jgi:phospholipase D3/4
MMGRCLFLLLSVALAAAALTPTVAKAQLVESMPQGMDDLNATVELHMHTAVIGLLDAAHVSVDIAAMYWSLLPADCGAGANTSATDPEDLPDCAGFSDAELEGMLAGRGRAVLSALQAAATRGVEIRILQSAGFPSEKQGGTPNAESAALAAKFPASVAVRTLNMSQWYGDGIQHSKYMIVDGANLLLGSSNFCDWRSLSQVKELGLLVTDAPALALDLGAFFADCWAVAALDPDADPALLRVLADPETLHERTVPCWSPLLPAAPAAPGIACVSPLPASAVAPSTRAAPLALPLATNGSQAAARVYVSCSPAAFCGHGGGQAGRAPLSVRTGDEEALVRTITGARTRVSIAVMDFVPASMR